MLVKSVFLLIMSENLVFTISVYIIPLDKIKYIGNKKIKLSVAELPVSDSYFSALKGIMNK